jgi:hypothetical protein
MSTFVAKLCCAMLQDKGENDAYGIAIKNKLKGILELLWEKKEEDGATGEWLHLCWLTGRHGRESALAIVAWISQHNPVKNSEIMETFVAAMSPSRGCGWKA